MKLFKAVFFFVICLFVLAFSGRIYAGVVDKVLVVVNDEVVTQREFDRLYEPVKQNFESKFKGEELDRRIAEAKEGILQQLINAKLAVSLAKKKKIEVDEKELDERIEKIQSYYPSEDAFLKALSEKGTNLTEFKKELREQMLAQKIVSEEVASNIVITPAQIKELYEKNKDKMIAPPKAKVRGIMVRKTNPSEEGKNRQKINRALKQVRQGKDFAEVATKVSEGPYADRGGDMGYIVPGQTIEQIDTVVFNLKKGEVSEVVETTIGYHIFTVEDMEDSRALELSEVSEFLREQLYMKQLEEEMIEWIEEKRKNAYIAYK